MEAPTSSTATTAESDLKGTTADQNSATADQNGTTAVKNGTTADQNRAKNGTTADQTPTTAHSERQERQQRYLRSLHARGGFVLSCKTVVTLHTVQLGATGKEEKEEGGEGRGWEMVGGGILSIVSQKDNLSLVFSDPQSGEVTQEFKLGVSACSYASLSNHFHSFVAANGNDEENKVIHGMGFADVDVASKVFRVVRRLLASDKVGGATAVAGGNDNTSLPATKRVKLDEADKYSEWVVINEEDVPGPSDAKEAAEGGKMETDGGIEETDFSLFPKKKDDKNEFKIDEISGPSYFRHLTQTSGEPQTEVASTSEEEVQKRSGTFERGTKRSSSFMEFSSLEEQQPPLVPIPVSPPIAPSQSFSSSSEILTTSSSFASSFSGSSIELPPPPPHDSSQESMIFQINTFDRKELHHVTAEEMGAGGMGEKESGLGSLLRGGFERMLLKLKAQFGDSEFASLSSEGEEEGFDNFDGTLFE